MALGDRSDRIDKDRPALLPRQVADDLTALIDAGELKGKLPAETDLAETYDVARITVRRAIAELVAEGRLVVQRGRGTFVV